MSYIKIIVQSTPKSIELLEYIDANIAKINKMGLKVNIEIASPKRIAMLEENHINRLPVMITPDSKLIVGVPDIKSLIEKNTSVGVTKPSKPSINKPIRKSGQVDDVGDYLLNEITSGITHDNKGRIIVPQDKEADDEDHFDYTKERKKYIQPKHHRNITEEEEEDEPPAPKNNISNKNTNRNNRPEQKRSPPEDDIEEDNVEDDDVHSQMLNILLNDG